MQKVSSKVLKICIHCNKEFNVFPSVVKRGLGKCCSLSCSSIVKRTGKRNTPESRKKMSLSHIGKNLGKTPWNKGIKWTWRNFRHSEETKALLKITRSRQGPTTLGKTWKINEKYIPEMRERMLGKNNHRLIEDRSLLKKFNDEKKDRRSSAYAVWRKEVWTRDKFQCKIKNESCLGRIEAHHILGWSEYPELRYQINNGITLCHAHHPRKKAEEKRLIPTFKELVSVSN